MIIEDIEEDPIVVASIKASIIDSEAVDHFFNTSTSDDYKPGTCYLPIIKQAYGFVSILSSVDPLINDKTLYQMMGNCADLGKYQMEICSTIASDPGPYLIEYALMDNDNDMDNEYASMGSKYDDHLIGDIYEGTVYREIDID